MALGKCIYKLCSDYLFYLFPKTKVNRGEEETSVKLKVVKHKNELVPNSPDHNGCIEGEYMDINLSSGIENHRVYQICIGVMEHNFLAREWIW